MIAIDTNLLVYAHRKDSPFHSIANQVVGGLAQEAQRWAIPWPCLYEFFSVVTHPRVFKKPTPLDLAWEQVNLWLASPGLTLLAEEEGYVPLLRTLTKKAKVTGPRVHDARIAALCVHYKVRLLWTADRDFHRFPMLAIHNPLLESP